MRWWRVLKWIQNNSLQYGLSQTFLLNLSQTEHSKKMLVMRGRFHYIWTTALKLKVSSYQIDLYGFHASTICILHRFILSLPLCWSLDHLFQTLGWDLLLVPPFLLHWMLECLRILLNLLCLRNELQENIFNLSFLGIQIIASL